MRTVLLPDGSLQWSTISHSSLPMLARLTVTEQLQNVPMPMPGPSDVYVPMTSALVGTHSGSGSGSGDGISLPRPTAPSATTSSQLPPCLPCLHAPAPLAVTHGLGWHALVCPPSPAVHTYRCERSGRTTRRQAAARVRVRPGRRCGCPPFEQCVTRYPTVAKNMQFSTKRPITKPGPRPTDLTL